METPNFSSHVCCFYDFVSGSDLKCSSFVLSVQWVGLVLLLFLFSRPRLLLPASASILFRRCLGVSSISVWVRSPFCSCAEAAATASSGEFAPPFVRSLLVFSARFLCCEFAWSVLVLSAGLACCEPQATPVSSSRLNPFWFEFPLHASVLIFFPAHASRVCRFSFPSAQRPDSSIGLWFHCHSKVWPLCNLVRCLFLLSLFVSCSHEF
jgi:hypothetical protein